MSAEFGLILLFMVVSLGIMLWKFHSLEHATDTIRDDITSIKAVVEIDNQTIKSQLAKIKETVKSIKVVQSPQVSVDNVLDQIVDVRTVLEIDNLAIKNHLNTIELKFDDLVKTAKARTKENAGV
jgi:hypothetical protein